MVELTGRAIFLLKGNHQRCRRSFGKYFFLQYCLKTQRKLFSSRTQPGDCSSKNSKGFLGRKSCVHSKRRFLHPPVRCPALSLSHCGKFSFSFSHNLMLFNTMLFLNSMCICIATQPGINHNSAGRCVGDSIQCEIPQEQGLAKD